MYFRREGYPYEVPTHHGLWIFTIVGYVDTQWEELFCNGCKNGVVPREVGGDEGGCYVVL